MINLSTLLVFCLGLSSPPAGADGSGRPCDVILAGHVVVTRTTGPEDAPVTHDRRATFRTRFDVARVDGGPADARVAELVIAWASDRSAMTDDERGSVRTELTDPAGAAATQLWVPRLGIQMQTEHFAEAGALVRRVYVDIPDRRKSYQRWRTSILTKARTDGAVEVAIERAVYRTGEGYVRAIGFGSRPSLVDHLLEDPALKIRTGGTPLKPFPLRLYPEGVPAFVDAVLDPARAQPLIYVSRRTGGRTANVDVETLAERLRGVATVVIEHAGERDLPVTGLLQRALGDRHAHGGEVRVFGPGGEDWGRYRPDRLVDPAVIVDKLVRLATVPLLREPKRR